MKTSIRATSLFLLIVSLAGVGHAADRYAKLEQGFAQPPASARPWVYWFWLNGNITSNGITADLEAMARVGIGGVLIMEVDQGAPKGAAAFGQPGWRELFKHVTGEAHRLGLEVNMNNDAGWCGSGGPWITPDLAMQKVVWTETNVQGPMHFSGTLAQPKAVANYYQDIAVLAFPTPAGKARIEGIQGKAAFTPTFIAPQASFPPVPAEQTVARRPSGRPAGAARCGGPPGLGRARGEMDDRALRPHADGQGQPSGAGTGPRAGMRQAEPEGGGSDVRRAHGQAGVGLQAGGREVAGRDAH